MQRRCNAVHWMFRAAILDKRRVSFYLVGIHFHPSRRASTMGTKPGKTVRPKAASSGKALLSADAAVLSSGEIAERIARAPEELPAIRERLRHWTREGLLVPIGDRNPGSGK